MEFPSARDGKAVIDQIGVEARCGSGQYIEPKSSYKDGEAE